MLKNYLKIAFRALWRNKTHSLINILGLSLGILCCVLIALYVHDEWTFDQFHSKADRIYRVYAREDWGENQQFFYTSTPFPMGPTLKDNFQEVEKHVRFSQIGSQVRIGDKNFSETVMVAGEDLFDVFDFELIAGDRATAMHSQGSVVLTENYAIKYFGSTNVMDKPISVMLNDKFEEFQVKGVVANLPTNSSITFDIMISDLNYTRLYQERVLTSAWFNINPETYVLLRKGANPKALEAQFPALFKKILGEQRMAESKYAPGLQLLTAIHLDTQYPAAMAPVSNPKYGYILAAIALLILFVACINFVTLSIGRSMKRAREVGIRKVVGAARRQLIFQFIGEALLVTLISAVIGVAVSRLALPLFNNLSGKQLIFPADMFITGVVASLLVIIGVIAGSYPAFVLSAFKPVSILKGNVQSAGTKLGVRKVLVGIQLVLSIFLISSTLVMRQQLQFLQSKDLGFNREQLMVVQLNVKRGGRLTERVALGFEKAEQFKGVLASFPAIASVCGSSHDFGNGGWVNVGYTDDKKVYRTFDMNVVDDDYMTTLGMKLVAGRNFDDNNPSDKRRSVIVNESFVKEYGWADPIGKRIPGKDFPDHEIIGVVKDFNYSSLYTKVGALAIVEEAGIILQGIENINTDNTPIPKLMIRLKAGNTAEAIEQVRGVWINLTGGEEFTFSFVDQALARQYRNDQNLGRIVSIATLLAIVIGSLGLYALASLAMQNRTKEISIRKVMGATEKSLLVLLSKDYVTLILVSLVVSVPFTIFLMKDWLATFEYRISVGWGVFAIAGGISLLIATLTIAYNTLRTAWTQPAETLRCE